MEVDKKDFPLTAMGIIGCMHDSKTSIEGLNYELTFNTAGEMIKLAPIRIH